MTMEKCSFLWTLTSPSLYVSSPMMDKVNERYADI
jgi:hypothetical protein